MKKITLTTLLLVITSAAAQAELISNDFIVTGDNLLTLDTQTNLKWLDLSFTAVNYKGSSYETMLTNTNTAGHLLNGFRYATKKEVEDLFTHSNLYFDSEKPKFMKIIPFATPVATQSFLNMISSTYKSVSSERAYGITATACIEYQFRSCTYSNSENDLIVSSVAIDKYGRTYASSFIDKVKFTDSNHDFGHFLVLED